MSPSSGSVQGVLVLIFLKGFVIGIAIAAPVGAIGVLCIRRTFVYGRSAGLLTGLGAATADALYGAIAAFGLTAVSSALVAFQDPVRIGGGVALIALGVKTLFEPAATVDLKANPAEEAKAYFSGLALTLTNPMTILSFIAVFASIGVMGDGSMTTAAKAVAGVFCGSAAWWFALTTGITVIRARIDVKALRLVNIVSGTVITGFGVLAALSGLGAS